MIKDILIDIFGTEVPEAAVAAASEAIVKMISDGFVRKPLYKEKLAELDALSEKLAAADGELAAAVERISGFEQGQRRDEARVLLEAGGASPHFIGLLQSGLQSLNREDIASEIDRLKTEYPLAFGDFAVLVPDVAARPCAVSQHVNPWSRGSADLDAQTRVYRENPVLAVEMARVAGVKL
jgi:hypothetical protein